MPNSMRKTWEARLLPWVPELRPGHAAAEGAAADLWENGGVRSVPRLLLASCYTWRGSDNHHVMSCIGSPAIFVSVLAVYVPG